MKSQGKTTFRQVAGKYESVDLISENAKLN